MPIDGKGSLIDDSGELRHFSPEAFAELAADPTRCFLCGSEKASTPFNDEHVVSNWILRRFKMHAGNVTLPNASRFTYGQYTLRCCVDCNSLLGSKVETPVSGLLSGDFGVLTAGLSTPNNSLLYQWLCLLFIKTHLKDRDLRADRDLRQPFSPISSLYEWERLHHIHTVSRAARSRSVIDSRVQGSILVFEMAPSAEPFDYSDLYDHSTVMVRVGSIGLVAVLNDCCASSPLLGAFLSGVTGPISRIQLREIAARAAYANELLVTRPKFRTELHDGQALFMTCEHADRPEFGEADKRALGSLIQASCAEAIEHSETPNKKELIERLATGDLTFLYDNDGKFISS